MFSYEKCECLNMKWLSKLTTEKMRRVFCVFIIQKYKTNVELL